MIIVVDLFKGLRIWIVRINLTISGLISVHDHVSDSHTSVEVNLTMGEHLTPLTPHHKNISSNFSIENILSTKDKEHELEPEYTDISEDEIDINDDDQCLVDSEIETMSSCYAPIQPKPLDPSTSLFLKPTFSSSASLSLDSDSSNNFFYSHWLAAASKPTPIFFGLQGYIFKKAG